MQHYLLSIYQPDGDPPPAAQLETIAQELESLRAELRAAGAWVFAGGLEPPAAAVVIRPRREGMPMTDGPYVEAKEHIGGFNIIEAASLEEAIGWARKLARATTLPIEVRAFHG